MSPRDVEHKTENGRPKLLFHGSPRKDLLTLRPSGHRALHASDDIRLAVAFLARPEHCYCVRSNGAVQVWVGESKEAFRRRDRGGSIYLVESHAFSPLRSDHGAEVFWEYTTHDTVSPVLRIDYASALAAFVAHGVQVQFVTVKSFRRFDATNSWPSPMPHDAKRNAGVVFASGILPVCRTTGRICLAWRSQFVGQGDCWGTLGGAAMPGQSLRDSAIRELREETGYDGEIELQPVFEFAEGSLQYQNFIGSVPVEFTLSPSAEHSWETVSLAWRQLGEWRQLMRAQPHSFHPGVLRLFRHAEKLIASFVKCSPVQNTHQGFNSDSGTGSGRQPSNTGISYSRPEE
ncbi:MAG: NUDIX domain-containing protein [Candidatus Sulfotelmatobacter sp.]